MDSTQIAIEQLAGVVMIADADPQGSAQALGKGIANLVPLLNQHPQSARLALGLQVIAEQIGDSPDALDLLAEGISLLQRLYATNQRGSTQVDDPQLYDRIAAYGPQDAHAESASTATTDYEEQIDVRAIDRYAFDCFTEEAAEHIDAAEGIWLSLETDPDDTSQLDPLFRAYHTLKGAAGYANLIDVIQLAHGVESILDVVRSGQVAMQPSICDVGIESIDLLRGLIESTSAAMQGQSVAKPHTASFMERLRTLGALVDRASAISDENDMSAERDSDASPAGSVASPMLIEIDGIEQDFYALNINDLSTLGLLSGQLEDTAAHLADETPRTALLATAMGKILENIILEECDVDEAMDLLSHGCGALRALRTSFEEGGEEVVEDDLLFEQILAMGGVDDPARSTPSLSPEAQLIAADDAAMSGSQNEFLNDDEPEELAAVEVDEDIFADFSSEAGEHLNNAENALLSLEDHPEDDELLNTIFRAFHTIKGAAGFLNLTDVTHLAHSVEDVLDSARKKQLVLNQAIIDVALESIDLLKELLQNVEHQLESGTVIPRDVSHFVEKIRLVVSNKDVPAEAAASPAPSAAAVSSTPVGEDPAQPVNTNKQRDLHVRVGTEKLDSLINIVGELVIAQTQVNENPDVVYTENQKLAKDISQLMKISTDLQEIAMSMRMVPIRATFERMARMVRDLARKCDKQVEFSMSGEDTELDKNVVEEILDPLTHMVRNAVDHGVESSDKRLAAGKSEKGHVSLHAYHKGGNFVIELRDDGNGISREHVLQKAIERGLVQVDEELSDEEVYDLVFHPGLSTAEQISDVSGRGVGMDVVRRNIEKLRGKVEIQSKPGKGSTFTIRLPLTLAIIDGMVIGVGSERYILPLTSIISSLRPSPEQICTVMSKGEMVNVQSELYPLLRLHERFGVAPRYTAPWEGLVMLIEADGERTCLLVDELIGLQQVVIKGLDEELRQDPCLAGCAILGDGCIGLILDANGLVSQSREIGVTQK